MTTTETIERCKKLVLEEIEGCDQYLTWYENNSIDNEKVREETLKINHRRSEYLEMLSNLDSISGHFYLRPITGK